MKRVLLLLAICAANFGLSLVTALQCNAAPITMTYEASGPFLGTLNGVPFNVAGFTITAIGDTANRTSSGNALFISHDSASIVIDGLGVFDFTSGTETFFNTASNLLGFSRNPGGDLLSVGPGVTPWDMLTSYGPEVDLNSGPFQWGDGFGGDVTTNAGRLIFESSSGNTTTFRAVVGTAVVPEPTSLGMLVAGFAAFAFARRRVAL